MNTNTLFAIVLIGLLLYSSKNPTQTIQPINQTINNEVTTQSNPNSIDAAVSFTGKQMYEVGTSLKTEDVRVVKLNGGKESLGYFSLDSTKMDVTPNINYKFYYFFNTSPSTLYYPDAEDYTGKEQDSTDNVYGEGCAIDTTPTFWVENSGNNVQTATSNAQAISASGIADITLFIKAETHKCYGMPDAKTKDMDNVVCLLYNSTPYSSIKSDNGYASAPKSIRTSIYAGSIPDNISSKTINCYKFPVVMDREIAEIPLTITASSTEPTIAHNITVMSEDICFDLNNDNLNEIWDYEDEDSNDICAPPLLLGYIRVS